MDVNVLSSAYKRNVFELIREAIAQENVGQVGVYYVTEKAKALVGGGVQFPKQLTDALTFSEGIVHQFSENVNMKILNQTQSRQFARWFGDWQNHPKKASKVVDSTGQPPVVYQWSETGTEAHRSRDGVYWFSPSEDHAETKLEDRGTVLLSSLTFKE